MTLLARSELESRRFGLDIVRARMDRVDAKELALAIVQAACDIAIVRVPAGLSGTLDALRRLALPTRHADTLVYYTCDLTRYVPAACRNPDLLFQPARPDDLPELRALVAETFAGYRSHYHANPLFASDAVLAGYQEWAEGYVSGCGAGRSLWVARRDDAIVAFAACDRDPVTGDAEGVLYGVASTAAGGGIYGDLIRHTQAVAREGGSKLMRVSTQVNNFAVQKVWSREGFHMDRAYDTIHVDALLSAGEVLVEREVVFSADRIAGFAQATGDGNPIHVDEASARRAGFPGPIAHGVMSLAELSRVLGTERPGRGTVISHIDSAFLRPVVAGRPHRLKVRSIPMPGGPGRAHVVATLQDDAARICMLARCDILRRPVE